MNMSNNEKDEFIRKVLSNDKVMASGEEAKNKVKKEIDVSKIKLKKYTFGERRFIKLLGVLLLVSLVSNAYLIKNRNAKLNEIANNEPEIVKATSIEDNIENKINNEVASEAVNNEIENTALENVIPNTITVPKVEEVTTPIQTTELDEELLKKELERYSMSIGRFTEDADQLEKNTILLLIANDFFNNKVSENSGLDISAGGKYAMTADNVHLYLKELTGIQVETFLNSFVNYMKYNEKSKFYSSGPNSTDLKDEDYSISNMQVIPGANNEYAIKGDLERESVVEYQEKTKKWEEEIKAEYSLEATIILNKNYTYTPYYIKDFKAELKPEQVDNIDRLVDVEVQEENKK